MIRKYQYFSTRSILIFLYRIPSYGATNNQINNTFTSNDIEAFGKSIVLGGIDGITASYIAIATLVGARLTLLHILILGFANTFGNALSVGVSEYYSSKSHREFIQVEKRRAIWQYKNFREDEIREVSIVQFNLISLVISIIKCRWSND